MADKDPSNTLSSVSDQFTNIVQDLFNIEVNIILRDNITAQKMPNPRHALLDIGKEYCKALDEMEVWRRHYYITQANEQETEPSNEVMFNVMRRKFGFLTEEEGRAQNIDMETYERRVSHDVCDELGGFDAFDVLRHWADSFVKDLAKDIYLSPAQLSVLPRIKDNADLFKGMYSYICRRDPVLNDPKKPLEENLAEQLRQMPEEKMNPNTVVNLSKKIDPKRTIDLTNEYSRSDLVNLEDIQPLPLRDSDLVMIRKVWELGTEVIAMQTIVQVDGDVITRLNPAFLDEKKYPKLYDYHNKGVDIALEHWASLINIAKELVVSTARGISDRLRG
jgi:hypothetical protein